MKQNRIHLRIISENFSSYLPDLKQKKTRSIMAIALTLIGISFFAIFAINPTLSTIAQLNKQLSDSQLVEDQLTKKIENLSALRQQYLLIQSRLPTVFAAIPQTPTATTLLAQIQAIAKTSNVSITQLQISTTDLSADQAPSSSFTFAVTVKGNYDDIVNFINVLSNFDRIIVINAISINKDTTSAKVLKSSIQAEAYYKN